MDRLELAREGGQARMYSESQVPVAPERRHYLVPTRYFHFYLFYERNQQRTCWLPEGYRQ